MASLPLRAAHISAVKPPLGKSVRMLRFVNSGTVWGLALSPDPAQRWLYVADGRNEQIHVLDRESGERVGGFGRAGHGLGQFDYAHSMAVDSAGNLYVAETGDGKRVQRFVLDRR